MKEKSLFLIKALLVLFIFMATDGVNAQRLHDEERDKQAQEAAKLAEEITSKSTFETQLKNLDMLSKRDVELYFKGAKRQMEFQIRSFRTWEKVRAFVETVKDTLDTPDFISNDTAQSIIDDLERKCPNRTSELGIATCAAEAELGRLKAAVKESKEQGKELEEELKTRLEKVAVVEALVDKAETYLKSDSKNNKTIKELSDVFINLSKSYINYTNKLKTIRNEPRDDLRLLLQRIAVETLQLEADHWQTVGEIKLRRVEEQEELSSLVTEFENSLNGIAEFYPCLDSTFANASLDQRLNHLLEQKITDTFAKAVAMQNPCSVKGNAKSKAELTGALYESLHVAAALAARGETPMKLAGLRLAQEEHRYSIRQSAIIARGYEVAIGSGTKRLARFYAGGIRPEKIAQLIYTAATVAIPAVIAGK